MGSRARALMAIENILRKAKRHNDGTDLVPRMISVATYLEAWGAKRGAQGYDYLDGVNALADLSNLMKGRYVNYTIKKDFFIGDKKRDEVFVVFGLSGVSEYCGLSIDWVDDRIKDAIEAEVKK